jgi:hypothetical protein
MNPSTTVSTNGWAMHVSIDEQHGIGVCGQFDSEWQRMCEERRDGLTIYFVALCDGTQGWYFGVGTIGCGFLWVGMQGGRQVRGA